MSFFHLVEKKCTTRSFVEGPPEHPGISRGTSQEKTNRGLILELRHIEAVEMIRAAQIIREGDGDFGFADAGWTDEEERALRSIRMSQIQFSSLEHRADARKDMILSLDVGFKVSLQVTELGEKI